MAGRFNMLNNNKKTNTHSRSKLSRRIRTNSLPSSSPSDSTDNSTLSVPEDPDEYKSPSDFLSAVSIALMGGKFIAGQFYVPGIVVVFEAAIKMVNALRDAQLNTQEAFRLVRLTANYTNLLLDHASELSSMPSSSNEMKKLTKHLKTFGRICSNVKDVASRITDRNVFVGVFSASSDKDELQYHEQKLNDALGLFQTEVICKIDRNVLVVLNQVEKLHDRLDKLQVAPPYQCMCPDCSLMMSSTIHMGLDVLDPW